MNEKVISTPFKILSAFTFLFLFLLGFYAYLFSINPLASSSFASILANGLTIEAIDSYKNKIFTISSKSQDSVKANDLPKGVVNAILSIDYILDGSDDHCSPNNLKEQIANHCNYAYTNIIASHYILTSLLDANNFNNKNNEDLFFRLRKYLVVHWLTKNFDESTFFEFLLNYSYYDNGIIGINEAAKNYFGALDLHKLTTQQSVILAKKIFENNPYIYGGNVNNKLITNDNILDNMYHLGYISLAELQNAKKDRLSSVNSISSNLYQLFDKEIITQALPNTIRTNNIVVKTTLDTLLQISLSTSVNGALANYKIPSASILVLDKGKILSGFTTTLNVDKNTYFDYYPEVKVSNLVRPLLYLALFTKNKKVPNSLLDPEIQKIITTQIINPKGLNTQLFPDFAATVNNANNNGDTSINLENTALNKIAVQLYTLEDNLFNNNLTQADYDAISKITHLQKIIDNTSSSEKTLTDNFINLVNAYSIINQSGNYVSPYFITQIYTTEQKPAFNEQTLFNPTNTFVVRNNVFVKNNSGGNVIYHTLFDKNMVIAFYGNYTIGIWLGDLKNNPNDNYASNNYNNELNSLLSEVINNLMSSAGIHQEQEKAANQANAQQGNN
ncbi:transglycosylase domain-containing protein [Rickettsiales bacterium LUAb2]